MDSDKIARKVALAELVAQRKAKAARQQERKTHAGEENEWEIQTGDCRERDEERRDRITHNMKYWYTSRKVRKGKKAEKQLKKKVERDEDETTTNSEPEKEDVNKGEEDE